MAVVDPTVPADAAREMPLSPGEPMPDPVVLAPDPTVPPDPDPVPDREGVALLESGRVRIEFDGQTYTWRRPTMNELLDLMDRLEQSDEVIRSNPNNGLTVQTRELAKIADWAFRKFSDKRLPRDYPAWIASVGFFAKVRAHYQFVPSLPGNA